MTRRILISFLAILLATTSAQAGTKARKAGGFTSSVGLARGITFQTPFIDPANPTQVDIGASGLVFARAHDATHTATYVDPTTGLVTVASADQLRIEANGAPIEGARTNHFLQSGTPATQTSPSLATGTYTLSITGTGSISVAAGTATITGEGSATAGTPKTFVVTVAGTVVYTVTGTPSTAQSELGSFASSYIPTVATAMTRNADSLQFAASGNISETAGTVSATVMIPVLTTGDNKQILNVYRPMIENGSNKLAAFDGANVAYGASAFVAGAQKKIAIRWGSGAIGAVEDAGAIENASYDGAFGGTPYIGSGNGSTDDFLYGYVKYLRIWNRALTDAEMKAVTQ